MSEKKSADDYLMNLELLDAELSVMGSCWNSLSKLGEEARLRALDWLREKNRDYTEKQKRKKE